MPRPRRIAVTVLVLALLVATAAAFALAERLKLERSPVTAPQITRLLGPECGCPQARAELAVRFRRADRVITIPTPVRVDTTPPRVRLVSATPREITPDGDGRGDRVQYVYRSSELAYAVVYVDGRYAKRGRSWPAGSGRVRWRARREEGGYVPPGVYRTWIRLFDPAGNSSARSPVVVIRVLP